MKIGLDFGGVIDCDEMAWAELINNSSHEFYLISHCIADWDRKKRSDFAMKCKIKDLSFIHDPNDEKTVMEMKSDLIKENNIELYFDDYQSRLDSIKEKNPRCECILVVPENYNNAVEYIKNAN